MKAYFCKTTDHLQLSFYNLCVYNFVFLSCHNAVLMLSLGFRHKNHLVRVRKTSWFGLKYLFCWPQTRLEIGLTSI